MDDLKKQQLMGAVRTVLAAVLGWFVGNGWLSNEDVHTVDTILNLALPLLGTLFIVGWSAWQKRNAEDKTVVREAVAVNAGAADVSATTPENLRMPPVSAARVPEVIEAFKVSQAAEVVKADVENLSKGKDTQ